MQPQTQKPVSVQQRVGNRTAEEYSRRYQVIMQTPFCHFGLQFSADRLIGSEYLDPEIPLQPAVTEAQKKVVDAITCYINDPSQPFELEYDIAGTEFQCRVWDIMQSIPAGKVRTYGEVARVLKSSPRAVGNACRANHLPLIIPCHRIVSASGLGGFSGHTEGFYPAIKRQLLQHEGLEF